MTVTKARKIMVSELNTILTSSKSIDLTEPESGAIMRVIRSTIENKVYLIESIKHSQRHI